MSAGLPPPPINSPQGSYYWIEWYTQLTNILNGTGYPWTALNFINSDIADIRKRNHNELTSIQGGNPTGTSPGGGNAWHLTGRGYVDATGVGTGLPSGWTVTRTSAGVYTITHGLGLANPNIGATATSASAGVIVQYIDLTSTSSVVVHLTNPAGTTPTDGAFTFFISS